MLYLLCSYLLCAYLLWAPCGRAGLLCTYYVLTHYVLTYYGRLAVEQAIPHDPAAADLAAPGSQQRGLLGRRVAAARRVVRVRACLRREWRAALHGGQTHAVERRLAAHRPHLQPNRKRDHSGGSLSP